MLKHTGNTNNSEIRFVSRFTTNNIAPKLKKDAGHTKLLSKSYQTC